MATYQPPGVHLVGSINLVTTDEVFEQMPLLLPNRLRRIPDGETGKRHYFMRWQIPEVLNLTPDQIQAAIEKLPKDLSTHFDDYALESYALFKKRKEEGHILPQTRFQVSLPGVANVLASIGQRFQQTLEPRYEAALIQALHRIQDNIPHEELAIQIDVAMEVAFIEGAGSWAPYFDPIFDGVIERVSRFANLVAKDVELGFHLCYGDMEHRHFVEPYDLGLLVEISNALHKAINRPIQWMHMPVPKGRNDVKYFEPLKKMNWEVPELYLGVVHVSDEEGTRERIKTAKSVVDKFGIATECGMGRTPKDDFSSIMEILKNVSAPVM
ncbi:hypothetical protein BDV96DRAFT_611639 [Lophiotrema nucula]|uniref:Cobalamin-independent methionine synthase MetE C-terminal/archaeal domain-containing protein n=1 Tax=Lophiotrema nucula TaxID=690887 RepID=A0A6A5ZDT2_9PLEO|nr:hypothetical protein BDV96DRAFT_611639 [Lophiotrema nucula]